MHQPRPWRVLWGPTCGSHVRTQDATSVSCRASMSEPSRQRAESKQWATSGSSVLCRIGRSSVQAGRHQHRGHRGGHVRTSILAVSGRARSRRLLGLLGPDDQATALCARDRGDARSEQHHAAAGVYDYGTKWLCGPHEPGDQPSSGLGFEWRSMRKHCRQRAVAAGGRARAPGKRFVIGLSQPREVWPTRCTPGWPGSPPTARAPQPSRFGHTRITRARLLKVVARSRNASLAAHRASSAPLGPAPV